MILTLIVIFHSLYITFGGGGISPNSTFPIAAQLTPLPPFTGKQKGFL